MIEFKGMLSEDAVVFLEKRKRRILCPIAIIGILCSYPSWFYLASALNMKHSLLFASLMVLIPAVSALIFMLFPRKNAPKGITTHIIIDREYVTEQSDTTPSGAKIRIKDITVVRDHGAFYAIYSRGYMKTIICQKDLLVSGTFEELEEIFNEIIVYV